MYLLPRPYVCEKCGFEGRYSPHNPYPAPVLLRTEERDTGPVEIEEPVCTKCYADFLRAHCGVMRPRDS